MQLLSAMWLVVAHDLLEYRSTWMTSREICFLYFVQHNARFWKCLWDFFGFKRVKTSKKFSRSYLQRRKMEKPNLHNSRHRVASLRETRCFATCFRHYSPLCKKKQERKRRKKKQQLAHSPVARVPLLCFTTFWLHLWFYYWTDARQHGIYLLKIWI